MQVIAYDDNDNKIAKSTSDAPFTIEVIAITSPNGGETLTSEDTYNIEWNTYETKEEIAEVVLKYTVNEGKKWKRIITIKEDNPGTYLWTIPNVTKTKKKCKVKVQLKDKNGNRLGMDASDSYFTIEP